MSRDIKFRVWDKVNNKMYNIEKMYFKDNKISHVGIDCEGLKDEIQVIDINLVNVLQYTGLKDKNDKEIYEGDIVILSVYSHEEPIEDYEGQIGITPYGVGILGFNSNGDHDFYYISEITASINNFEVIGNIYENPNLLKEA
jgi:uncharacterized phage protein (TIGR01671 family)